MKSSQIRTVLGTSAGPPETRLCKSGQEGIGTVLFALSRRIIANTTLYGIVATVLDKVNNNDGIFLSLSHEDEMSTGRPSPRNAEVI